MAVSFKPVEHHTTSQCHHCIKRHLSVYFSYTVSLSSARHGLPNYCPTCAAPAYRTAVQSDNGSHCTLPAGRTTKIQPFDYADTLCFDNAGMSRKQACTSMEAAYTLASRAKSIAGASKITVEGMLSDVGSSSLPSLKQLATPLRCTCTGTAPDGSTIGCGGSYIFYRNLPDVQRTPPLYCVWCGSKSVTVVPCDTEDTAWFTLAQHYNLPVNVLQVLYNFWSSRPNYTTFSDFMHSDLAQQALGLATQPETANDTAQEALA